MLGQVEPAVQRGEERSRLAREQRERIIVEMEMQEVESAGLAAYLLEHRDVQCVGIADRAVESQRAGPARLQLRRGSRVTACKQRDVVTERDQLFDQPVHDPFGSAIKFRWNRLGQWSDLRDAH